MSAENLASVNETRERLLRTAILAFGQRDYDGVGTREIVQAAGVNIAAISYHFGGKQGLYLATVEYLAEQLYQQLSDHQIQVAQAIEAQDKPACADQLCDFLGTFLELLLSSDLGESAPGIIFREMHQPSDAYEILYQKLLQPIHTTLTRLVSCYRGEKQQSQSAIFLAHALLGQTVIFRISRTTLLKRLGKSTYSCSDIVRLKQQLSSYYRCLLNAPYDPKDVT
jgi:AcrR family transcriptional regulator